MAMLTLSAKLDRTDSSTSWGFRLHGGKDFSAPLTIQRVTPGSLAAKCGLQEGDTIVKIGNGSTDSMLHKQAQQAIIQCGNSLDLELQRRGLGLSSSSPQGVTNSAPGGGGVGSASTFPVAVNKQYNTPINIYSVDNVMDTLASQTANVNIGQPGEDTAPSNEQTVHGADGSQSSPHDSQPPTTNTSRMEFFRTASPVPFKKSDNSQKSTTGYRRVAAPVTATSSGSSSDDSDIPPALPLTQPPKQTLTSDPVHVAKPQEKDSAQHETKAVSPREQRVIVSAIVSKQYNSPVGLYSKASIETTVNESATSSGHTDTVIEQSERKKIVLPSRAEPEKKSFQHSATYKQIHEIDEGPPTDKSTVVHSKTFQKLQQQLDQPKPAGPAYRPAPSVVGTWKPPVPTGPRNMSVGQRGAARNMPASSGRVPVCTSCNTSIRGPFVMALDKTWCPDHFVCANPNCRKQLIDIGFVEEQGQIFCEQDYRDYFAPHCGKCHTPIIGEVVNALQNTFHSDCFRCCHCREPIRSARFHSEDGNVYCTRDWEALFQIKCHGCQFPVEPGDRWVEALSFNWHAQCFNCSTCQQNLEGQAFYAKHDKPYCKRHASGRV